MHEADGRLRVRVVGVDVFKPQTGEVVSSSPDEIACWFIDTDYNQESSFVRHAYFLGANDPYSSLKTILKAEIDADAWASLRSDTSRPFARCRRRANRREGNQSPWRRGDEGIQGVNATDAFLPVTNDGPARLQRPMNRPWIGRTICGLCPVYGAS